jgi:DNA processing protein
MSTKPSPGIEDIRGLHWVALSLTPGLGPTRARHLVEYFGSIDHVFQASLTSLEAAGIPAPAAQSLATGKSLELADEELVRARAAGVSMVTLDDPTYPAQLRQIYDPPLALYVRGNPELLSQPSLAIVGTRHPTPYGLGMAERLFLRPGRAPPCDCQWPRARH